MEQRTTEDLRVLLFETIESVKSGDMEIREASVISKLATNIVNTAELEIKYSQVLSRLDKDDQGISTGPLLLTKKASENG